MILLCYPSDTSNPTARERFQRRSPRWGRGSAAGRTRDQPPPRASPHTQPRGVLSAAQRRAHAARSSPWLLLAPVCCSRADPTHSLPWGTDTPARSTSRSASRQRNQGQFLQRVPHHGAFSIEPQVGKDLQDHPVQPSPQHPHAC